MQQTLACLVELQKVDSQILELVKQRDVYPERVRVIRNKIKEQELIHEQFTSQLKDLQQERTAKEQLLKAEEEKLKKWEKRLMESKKSREAAPLAREIDAQKRLNLEAQEDILRLIENEERLEKESGSAGSSLDQLRAEFKEEDQICQKKVAEFEEKLSVFNEQREQFTSKLRAGLLRKYNTIKQRRQGKAIVPARDGCCLGCNMRLPPQLYNIIQKNQSLDTCPSCKRILYWEKGLENGSS